MSTNNRRLSYWTINYIDSQEQISFDCDLFLDFLNYCLRLNPMELLINDRKNYKAVALKSIQFEEINSVKICKIVMKSCKYNHSPDFMSSIDGTVRVSDKTLSEGDEEITHLCMRIDSDESYVIFEQRVSGVSFGRFAEYLNYFFKKYKRDKEVQEDILLNTNAVLINDFEGVLGSVQKISSAELYTHKEIIGSEFLDLMEIDSNIRDEVVITIKAERRGSLSKEKIQQALRQLISGGSNITRMRLRCKDDDDISIMLDTINMKKKDEITVKLNDNGIVDTIDMFIKMKDIILTI